eukprot:s200_g43.t2
MAICRKFHEMLSMESSDKERYRLRTPLVAASWPEMARAYIFTWVSHSAFANSAEAQRRRSRSKDWVGQVQVRSAKTKAQCCFLDRSNVTHPGRRADAMSLLEAQRQRHKALGQRHGLGASEVIRQLRHDFEQETGTEARGPKSAAASQYQVAGFGFKAREDATSVAAARAEEIHGLFKTTEKKTNVLEVVRSVVNDTQEQKQVEPLDKSRKKIFKTLKRRMSDMHGDDLANSKIFGFLLGDGIWETCAACMNAWQNWFRRIKFERNRQSMRAALAWDDPERASAVMRARETLAKSDQVTWLSVQFCRKVNEEKLQSSVYPVTSPPKLRRESGETFSALAQELRHQLAQLLRQQMAAASEAERGVVQRWIIKEKTKDVKKAEARDEAAAWQLECAKRKLHQSPALAALFQQLYISSLTFSVEKTATTLTQMFADPSYLMIRIMAMPFAKETGEAMLVTSPNHADIQAHLNALLESVVSVAGRAPIVWQPRKPSMAEVAGEDLVVEMEHEKEDKDASAALQRSLMRSSSYRLAVRGLDAQLRRSFQVVERRLQGLQGQLEPMLLAQSAVLSQLYLDRRGLFEQILSVADKKPDAPRRSPAECEPDATTLTSPFLADFVMFWLSRPQHLERHGLPEKISVLLMNLFYSLAKVVASEKKATLPVAPLQPDTAACLSPVKSGIAESAALATIIADSVDGKGGGCASFHTALASVVDGSKSFLDLLLRPDLFLLRPAEFLGTVRGATYELSMVEGLCEWIRNLQRSCEQWERAVRNTRALSQCGPFALDFRYFSFIAEQTSPALLSLSTYALNIYAVNCGKRLWKEIYDWLQRFRKPPASWLSRAEQNMGHFQSNLRQLTPLIACLAAVTRSRLFTERLADVESGRSSTVEEVVEEFLLDFKDDDEGREAPGVERKDRRTDSRPAHGVGHPYGGLSTGTLQYLCLQSGEIFSKLQENVEKVLVTPERFGPMEELEREELLAAAEAAKVPEEAEEPLSPSISFALGRCGMARGVGEDVELAENARLKEEEESKQDKSHKEDKAKEKPEERKNSQVGSVDGSAVGEARKSSVEAQMQIRQDLQDLRSRCFRLFYLEDEVLLELMASSANVKMQQQIVSRCIPQLFPGWSAATFARHLESGTSSGGGLEHRSSSKRLASKRVTAHSDWVITAAETSGPSLQLLQAVPLHLPLQEWLHRLEQSVARSFAAALREESPHHWRSNELQQLRCSIEKQSLEQRFVRDQIPEHVAVTAERIRWTYIVEAWSSYEESLELLSAYLEHRVKEEVAQNTAVSKACAGAALMLMLELRALLGQAKEHQHEAQKLKFLRMAWRSAESLAVELGPLILEFGWELYGGEQLICPATERCYVELAQHLCATATCPVLQGTLGSTVTRAFAACCGIACHQCSILEPGQFRFCTGAGLLGHWVILHGIDDLEPQPREPRVQSTTMDFIRLTWIASCFNLALCVTDVTDVDVVVLGAGPSGLSTVQHLQNSNLSVTLLEKANRLGGRVMTLRYGDAVEVGVDLGPAWIHYGTANPLTYLAKQGNCSLVRTQNLNMDVYHRGKALLRSVIMDMFGLLDKIEHDYEQFKDANAANASLLLVLQQLFRQRKFNLTPEQQAAFAAILFGEVVEDWTAPLHELSAEKHCEYDNVDGVGSDWRILEGMECVVKSMLWNFSNHRMARPKPHMSQPLQLRLNHTASSVKLDGTRVLVEGTQGGEQWTLSAKTAVVAVPLGELREGHLKIEPLPRWKEKAWQELGLGHAIRAALEFETPFWSSEVEFFMDFIADCWHTEEPKLPVESNFTSDDPDLFLQNIDLCSIEFTSPLSASAPVLVAEADGRLAMKLAKLSDQQIIDFLISRLEKMFALRLTPRKSFVSRPWGLPFWHRFSQGRASARLAGKAAWEQRLFFAGDYVSHNVGTVASAYLSGIAAAHAVTCQLGQGQGLDLLAHPAVLPMIRWKCAKKEVDRKGGDLCKLSLWDLLYKCSALPELEDESGRTCFVQGHDKWTSGSSAEGDPRAWWMEPMKWWHWLRSWLFGKEAYLKFLSKFFLQLSQSLEVFRDKRMEDPLLSLDFLNLNRASSNTGGLQFAKLPPGSMKVHNVSCTFDTSKLLFSRSDRGRATSFSFEARRREVDMEIEVGSLRRSHSCPAKQTLGGAESALEFEVKAQIVGGIPRSLHPAVALWAVAAEGQAGALHGQPLRNLSFPPADLTLYIHAGLIRIGILDMDAARMLTRAISAFNTFSGAEASTSTRLRKGRHPHISIGEIRSICTFAASFKRAHSSHDLEARTKTLDEQILCEAWLCAIGAQLDAGPQREMLWRCTVMSFGHSACFEAQQHALRQNLFNDTLMAQRVAKKDLSTRFYIRIADTLRQKFSFDFYNPMVVQKCIATTQALLNDRDVAVVGDAGAGKTDCIMTLLEAAEDFPDDLGRPLFPRVKLLRINTLAHNVEGTLMVVARAAETECKRITTATDEREDCIWLTLDGPVNPELFEAVSSAMPLTMAGRPLSKARAFRMIVETDNLAQLSPATAAGLAVTYIDTERGPTWKDRAMAWTHRFVLSRPEYAHFMNLTSELLMHLMDSILAFVLYYFHFNPSEISAAATEGEALDYRHQTSCFLSLFTSFLVDPVVEKQLIAATEEGEEALERQVRLLIGMSSISAFGASLFTSQRPRFERYIRENVLDPIHADSFPSLYDLYFDSKSGQFQAVGQIVNMKEPLVEAHNICVATEEFVAFQLRLHRLLSINAPVLLAGTAGSGKSALLRYLNGCSSSSTVGLLRNCPDLEPTELQQVLTMNLSEEIPPKVTKGKGKSHRVHFADSFGDSFGAPNVQPEVVLEEDPWPEPGDEVGLAPCREAPCPEEAYNRMMISQESKFSSRPKILTSKIKKKRFESLVDSESADQPKSCLNSVANYMRSVLAPAAQISGSTGVLEPGNEKRLVVFIDDLHLSSIAATSWRLQAVGQQYRGRGSGGQSQLGEWIRFALESQGFYRDGHFVPIRDTSFLPSLLAPNSQNLEVCKRFTRHFFLAFMEIPSEASIQNIFSTILTLNLSVGLPDEVLQNLTATFSRIKLHPNVEIETPGQKLAAQLLQATLAVWAETDWATKQRLHGLARVFWDVAHAFSRVPVEEGRLRSQLDVGYLWAFVMRTSVLDALLLPEAASHRRRVYGAVARSCKAHFGLLLGGKAGLEDPDLQTLELDSLAFSAIVDGQIELSPPGLRSLRRVNLVQARDDVLQRIGNPAYVTSHEGQLEKEMSTSSHSEESEEEGMADEESENELDQPPQEPEGGDDGSGEFSIDRKFKKQRNEDTEQAAPDPVSLVMCKELLSIDNDASLMWLLQEETLCTLLRLSHVLTTYPITCLVGGWTHLPLLGLVGKLLAGSSRGELHLCTNVTAESLERELLKSSSAVQQTRRKPQKLKAQQKKVEGGLRVLCVSEHDFPAEAPEAYLAREQSRFFRPGGGALGDANDEKCVSKRDEVEEDGQKRLVVICRSPASLQELFTRCGFLRQTLVATFNVLPPMSLQQVAFVYLGKRLSSRIDLGALPKAQKKLLMHRSHFLGSQGGRASIKKFAKGATTGLGQSWQQQLFIPLAKIVESLHLRIRDVLAVELGRDVALEFCSASRFSMFVQTIARLAMHHRSVQNHRGTMHESARNRLKSLEKFLVDLDTKLRSMHVSLKLLAEESRRLLSRSAREHELQTQATASLAEVRERKKLVESHIAAVDARHGSDFEKALSTAASSLRQLKQLERCHFESLAQYQHLPAPLVRALGAAKAVLLHVSGAEEGEDASVPIFKRRRVPSSALAAACAAAGGAQVGVLKVSKTPTRAEIFEWADALAKPQTLEVFNSWDGTQPLPGWLAEVLQSFLLSPDCHFSTLWSMSPAASRLSQWLHGRLECHRVLMRMEDDRQSMGDLSTQLIEVTAAVKAAEAELKRAEDTLERLQAAHAETVQKRQLLLRTESGLQRQSARATRVLEIAAPRRRECEVVVPLLRDAEESPEQWGAILTIGVLSCYGASFGHALRQPIMKELQQVLQEGGVPTPSNLFTSAYLRGFFPQTLVQKAVDAWPNSHLLQGTVATEASGSLCALMLDPFGNALEWLKELHTQRNPVASGGGDRSEFDKHLQRLLESRGIAKEPGVADGDVNNFEDSENEWEDMPQAKASDQDCVQPMLCSSNETPELLTSKLQHCMLEGQIMILQLEDLSSLRGFVGTLLVLLSGSSAQVRLTTERHSVLFSLSQRFTRALAINAQDVATGVEAESDELRVRVFSMLQRLEAALPMVHYHFHLYVIAPRCHWSRCLWGPAKTKQVQGLQGGGPPSEDGVLVAKDESEKCAVLYTIHLTANGSELLSYGQI